MGALTPGHLIVILVIALIVIGPGKLPEVGAALGKSFREFQKATGSVRDAVDPGQLLGMGQTQQSQPIAPQYAPQQAPQYGAPQYGAPQQVAPMYTQAPVYAPQAPVYGQQPPQAAYYPAPAPNYAAPAYPDMSIPQAAPQPVAYAPMPLPSAPAEDVATGRPDTTAH